MHLYICIAKEASLREMGMYMGKARGRKEKGDNYLIILISRTKTFLLKNLS